MATTVQRGDTTNTVFIDRPSPFGDRELLWSVEYERLAAIGSRTLTVTRYKQRDRLAAVPVGSWTVSADQDPGAVESALAGILSCRDAAAVVRKIRGDLWPT